MASLGMDPDRESIIVDPHASVKWISKHVQRNHCPCITKNRGSRPFWITNRRRMLQQSELCRLQGFDPTQMESDRASCGIAKGLFGQALGNAMHGGVLKMLVPRVLLSTGLISRMP
jgi:hypothetical protein